MNELRSNGNSNLNHPTATQQALGSYWRPRRNTEGHCPQLHSSLPHPITVHSLIKILCRHSHFHLPPADWCHPLMQTKNNKPALAVCPPLFSVHLLQNSNPNSNTEELPETRGLLLLAVGAITVIKTEGSQRKSKGSFCAFMQPQTALSLLPLPKTAKQAWELQLPQDYDSKSHFISAKAQSIFADTDKRTLLRTYHINNSQSFPNNRWAGILQRQHQLSSLQHRALTAFKTHQSHANQPCTQQGLTCLSESRQCLSLPFLLWS